MRSLGPISVQMSPLVFQSLESVSLNLLLRWCPLLEAKRQVPLVVGFLFFEFSISVFNLFLASTMISMRQQNPQLQRKIKSTGVGATPPASPSIAELVQLNKLGILTKSEVREIILRSTPSPSLPNQKNKVVQEGASNRQYIFSQLN